MVSQIKLKQRKEAYEVLIDDAEQILRLIEVQIENFMMPQCPLYEEVLDTQMFGLSREIDFATRLDLIDEAEGKAILDNLERKLNVLHETAQKSL